MDLYFSRRRIFQTSFHAAAKSGAGGKELKEMYRITTTKGRCSVVPDMTIIEYVGADDEDKFYTVATIHWRWLSPVSSYIYIGGKTHPLDSFLTREAGWLNTGTHISFGDELLTWRSAVCRPAQLYDSQGRSIARFLPQVRSIQSTRQRATVKPVVLQLSHNVVDDAELRDLTVVSFFAYKALRTPWWYA